MALIHAVQLTPGIRQVKAWRALVYVARGEVTATRAIAVIVPLKIF